MDSKRSSSKISVLMCVQEQFVIRDLLQGGALQELANKFDMKFVVAQDGLTETLSPYGEVVCVHRLGRIRFWVWHNLSILMALVNWSRITGNMTRDYYNRKKVNNYRGFLIVLVLLNKLQLGGMVSWMWKHFLDATIGFAIRYNGPHPAVVLAPTVMRDALADDTVRWAKARGIPALFIQMQFDTFNIKSSTVIPDYFAVWGEQSWYIARLVHRYRKEQLLVIGAPKVSVFLNQDVDRKRTRAELGFTENDIVLFFCGATAVYDENRALRQIDTAISEGQLPGNLKVLYKPHPKGLPAGSEIDVVPYPELTNVRRYKGPPGWSALEEYPQLFRSVDLVLTPFSSMGIEAAFFGKPVICVGYHETRQAYWDVAQFLHHKVFYDNNWCHVCKKGTDLITKISTATKKIDNPDIAVQARESARSVMFWDDEPFTNKLVNAVSKIAATES